MARGRQTKANGARSLAPKLARVGDPLVWIDGRVIQAIPARVEIDKNQPRPSEAKFKPSKKRGMNELPAPVTTMNGVACIMVYTILGIGDREMADALKITTKELKEIRDHPAYAECFDLIHSEFISVNSDNLHARIAAYGNSALTSLANIAINGEHESNKLKGSIDLLDRGGFTKKVQDKGGRGMEPLRVVYTDGDKSTVVEVGIGS